MNFLIILVNRLASKRKINHDIENITESDDESNTESDLNILSLKRTKKTNRISKSKNDVNNNVQKRKSKFYRKLNNFMLNAHAIFFIK